MRALYIALLFVASLNAQSFDKLFDKIMQPNVKLATGKDKNYKLVKMIQNRLYEKNISTQHNIYKDEVTIRITDIQEKHNKFWEIDYDKYIITYQVINGSKSLTNSETILFEYPSAYSLYARLFLILIISISLFKINSIENINIKGRLLFNGIGILLIMGLIQGYFFVGAI